jgi:hypothetical protein
MATLRPGATFGQVAEIVHTAVLLGPAAWGRKPMPEAHTAADIEEKLKSQLIKLFQILHDRNIPYLLVGAIAILTYVEGRNTNDVDLVLSVGALAELPEVAILEQIPDFANCRFGDLVVDFLFTSNPLFELVGRKHRRRALHASTAPKTPVPDSSFCTLHSAFPRPYPGMMFSA